MPDPTNKQTKAWLLRKEGKTFQEIADTIGVTRGGASHLVKQYERKAARHNLPSRAAIVLKNHALSVDRPDEIVAKISEVELLRDPNCGRKTVKAIKEWLSSQGLTLSVLPPQSRRLR